MEYIVIAEIFNDSVVQTQKALFHWTLTDWYMLAVDNHWATESFLRRSTPLGCLIGQQCFSLSSESFPTLCLGESSVNTGALRSTTYHPIDVESAPMRNNVQAMMAPQHRKLQLASIRILLLYPTIQWCNSHHHQSNIAFQAGLFTYSNDILDYAFPRSRHRRPISLLSTWDFHQTLPGSTNYDGTSDPLAYRAGQHKWITD